MAERITTGGTKSFVYKKGDVGELDEERKKGIAEGYEKYYERKARERKNKIILWTLVGIIVILVLIFFLLKNF